MTSDVSDGTIAWHILSSTHSPERLWETSLPGDVIRDSSSSLNCKLPELQEDKSSLGPFLQAGDGTTVSHWIISPSALFSDPSQWYPHQRLRCWVSLIWEVEKGVCWSPRLLTLAVILGCSATPHPSGAQDVFVSEGLSFIALHRDAVSAVLISGEGQAWATGESLHSGPRGIEKLGVALESGEGVWNN